MGPGDPDLSPVPARPLPRHGPGTPQRTSGGGGEPRLASGSATARPCPTAAGEFYGQSYFCDPRGQILEQAARDQDEIVIADLDLDAIREVRNTWQFFRDRRPESYGEMVEL